MPLRRTLPLLPLTPARSPAPPSHHNPDVYKRQGFIPPAHLAFIAQLKFHHPGRGRARPALHVPIITLSKYKPLRSCLLYTSARSQAVMAYVNDLLAKVHLGPLSEHTIRKLAHFLEFTVAGFLLMLCIRVYTCLLYTSLGPFSTLGWPNENAEDYNDFYPTNTLVTGYDPVSYTHLHRQADEGVPIHAVGRAVQGDGVAADAAVRLPFVDAAGHGRHHQRLHRHPEPPGRPRVCGRPHQPVGGPLQACLLYTSRGV